MAIATPLPGADRASAAPPGLSDPSQYSLAKILAVWAAAALPMAFLAWVAAPWLADRLDGPGPLTQALLLCLTAGLIWQFVLVLALVARSRGRCAGRACAPPCGCRPRAALARGGAEVASGCC